MEIEFLMQEYSQMFEEKRHYDNRLFSFVAMYFTLLTICVSVVSFTYESLQSNILFLVLILSIIQVLTGIVVVISLYFNRVSSVKVYRQINSIRNFNLENSTKYFAKYNIMERNSSYPKYFKVDSLHFVAMAFIICINSICIGILAFCILNIIYIAIILAALFMIGQLLVNICFLAKRDKK